MFGFIRRRNAAPWAYRRKKPAVTTGATEPASPAATGAIGSERPPGRPNAVPAWAAEPTVAFARPGRAGWLTPAQTWRANGGRW
ncbi:hypothetical protein GA0070604_6185 [Micromonospora eburnea]|uniref:Uncharacterized protein n=1 Tax=Micromonospora eburnea TaxID=227316 RepID=A0A1C6VP18_9ACTN|nr:hypothetical protein GA0070604_6185 [Micromonospora eburnea]